MAKLVHRRACSNIPEAPPSENIEGQLDRLNKALQEIMQEIEISSCSRNPSRMSIEPSQLLDDDQKSCSFHSEENYISEAFEAKIEEFLLNNDRNEMIIEDYRSEEIRRLTSSKFGSNAFIKELKKENEELRNSLSKASHCTHDMNRLRKEIWLQVKMQKNEQTEKERKNFEEKLVWLDELKEDYLKKRAEIMLGIEKLKLKEQLLEQKEKELRQQRLTFDRHKLLWNQDHGISDPYTPVSKVSSESTPTPIAHNRASSFSDTSSLFHNKHKAAELLPYNPKELPMKVEVIQKFENKEEQLKFFQLELKKLESEIKNKSDIEGISRLEMNIDQLKNRIATLRGELAISESLKATKVISSMMMAMKRDAVRDDKTSRIELVEQINMKLIGNPVLKPREKFPVKAVPIEIKVPEVKEVKKISEILTPRASKKEESGKVNYDKEKKALFDKEKELIQKEALLQQTWMKIPGSKELIENVNLTLNKLTSEKNILDKEREEFEREKIEWVRSKEKFRNAV